MEDSESNPNVQNSISKSSSTQENERPVGYYKPNIWSYDHLQTLVTDYNIVTHSAKEEKLKEKLVSTLDQATNASAKLQIIDNICNLGLANLFNKEIMEGFDGVSSDLKTNPNFIKDVTSAALCFRLLRQHGYTVSQDVLADFLDDEGAFKDIKKAIELYEASYLALEDDKLLIKANTLLHEDLLAVNQGLDGQMVNALGLPLHWKAQWFGVRQQIDAYEMEVETNPMLLELAKVNFRRVQVTHQTELRDLTMWWKSLGLKETISFARDRLVESFVFAVGVAPEPRWDWEETFQLPGFMKICFSVLSDTTDEIVMEIHKETGFCGALPYLRKAWADFCKSMLTEARRYNERHTPTLGEYLNTGWVSSSGSLLSMVILLLGTEDQTAEKLNIGLEETRDLVYHTSLIIRLCNDVATTAAELERGDSPSSILCYMREVGVTEEVARLRIKDMIFNTWKKINAELLKESSSVQPNVMIQILNTARVAQCFYHTGDGFGVQDGDIKRQIKHMLIEPLQLD